MFLYCHLFLFAVLSWWDGWNHIKKAKNDSAVVLVFKEVRLKLLKVQGRFSIILLVIQNHSCTILFHIFDQYKLLIFSYKNYTWVFLQNADITDETKRVFWQTLILVSSKKWPLPDLYFFICLFIYLFEVISQGESNV